MSGDEKGEISTSNSTNDGNDDNDEGIGIILIMTLMVMNNRLAMMVITATGMIIRMIMIKKEIH